MIWRSERTAAAPEAAAPAGSKVDQCRPHRSPRSPRSKPTAPRSQSPGSAAADDHPAPGSPDRRTKTTTPNPDLNRASTAPGACPPVESCNHRAGERVFPQPARMKSGRALAARQYGAARLSERALRQFEDEKPRRIDRAGHDELAVRHAPEAEAAVIGLVANEECEGVLRMLARRRERTRHQRRADAALLESRVDSERAEDEPVHRAGAHRRQPHGADEQRPDERREGEVEDMRRTLAQALGRAREAAGSEGALV